MTKQSGRPTIRDVALAASVSVTTVSDTMNRKGRVDPATQMRVRQAAEAVGWKPKRSARALRSGRTGIIVFCLPPRPDAEAPWIMSTDYYMQLAAACAIEAVEFGRFVLLAPGPVNLADVASLDVDGAIVVDPIAGDRTVKILSDGGVPVVTIDRDLDVDDGRWVSADNAGATKDVLDHLAAQGARSILLLTSDERMSWLSDVSDAYHDWCANQDTSPRVSFIDLDRTTEGAGSVLSSLAKLDNVPDAIFAVPFGSAIGVLRKAAALSISVPEDLLVASGVDDPSLAWHSPSVTALDLVPTDVARAAVRLMVDLLEGEGDRATTTTRTRLIERESTRR